MTLPKRLNAVILASLETRIFIYSFEKMLESEIFFVSSWSMLELSVTISVMFSLSSLLDVN